MFNAGKDWNVGIFPPITMASGNSEYWGVQRPLPNNGLEADDA